MSKLIIVRGPQGSGKTTFSNRLTRSLIKFGYKPTDICHFEADQFFEDEDGSYNFDGTKLWLAHKQCLEKTKKCLLRDKIVIVSNTFATKRELKPYFDFADENDIPVDVYRCTGEYQNVHNVPEEVVIAKRKQMEDIPNEELV
jgi:adenylate kinase family enzyme